MEFFSENRRFCLRVDPDPERPHRPGYCLATLYEGEQIIWSRYLINNLAPISVFVADSGKYVITMDEWTSFGELPVVIYGERGRLIRVHGKDSLGLEDDIMHIKITVSSFWWNEDAISFFAPEEERFFIRLHWGRWIVLDLRRGNLMREDKFIFRDDQREQYRGEWKELVNYREAELARRAIRMLDSEEEPERKTGALICGQEKLTEAIPQLRKLLADPGWFQRGSGKTGTIVLYVRESAREALEAMGERVDGVTTRLPVEGHLRCDRATGRFYVDFAGTQGEGDLRGE
ncbi:MAG: hypothetical protein P9M08_02860 [Candidatus Erginobacter occultus]|nr:hypothetical protein [Candidatus Erginobacter occultus]